MEYRRFEDTLHVSITTAGPVIPDMPGYVVRGIERFKREGMDLKVEINRRDVV